MHFRIFLLDLRTAEIVCVFGSYFYPCNWLREITKLKFLGSIKHSASYSLSEVVEFLFFLIITEDE